MAGLSVSPGALRTRLVLQVVEREPDGLGGFTESWSDVAVVFARVEPVRADSRFGAGRELDTITHRVTLRYREGIEPGMRFSRQGRSFMIVTVHDPDESGRYLVCRSRESRA
jgi:SPP1 family predicted phage head-tail adaptor